MKKGIVNILLIFALVTGISIPSSMQAEAAAPSIKVHFIDVGQGDAIYIKAPNGEDILKVSTQGSKNATSATFVNVVKPKYAIISVEKNGYDHPNSQTVRTLTKAKAKIYQTNKNKTIVVTGNGSSYKVRK
ncbi:hypothetical protein HCJ52_12995 [Listeria sp. FSL L7-1485]|uniref:Uncharacterized protein n=1 Tax=Listeria immobilis TaxID=2713502 RepID=A0A7X0X9A5_9LIST|nr:hypothetical protein [Listeria immobilis]MBC1489970.1 hypothetical protein [Listeria immobilis]MBC1537040.1 hypothetical protein [Listeria immobilis]